MDLAAGTLVDGKYRVVRPIGRGGMGAVYEVENVRIRKTVAMKLLSANAADDVVKRFEKEAQAAGQIGSEHIVEVHDLGTMPTGEPYMVMELLEGETLRQRLHREKRLTAEASIPILVQMLEGLGAAHAAGIVHRDLKPENIYLCSQRGGLRDWVKILDFGISKFASVSEDGMTKTGQVIGTPQYMAPEQIKAPQTVDGRTDLYAVGVIFYQLLTGQIPFKAKTYAELLFKVVYEPLPHPTSFVAGLDPETCEVVLTAMSRDPAARFATAAVFRDRLLSLGARLGAPPADPRGLDPMRAYLTASNAALPRSNAHDGFPSPSPSRPHGSASSLLIGSPHDSSPAAIPFGPGSYSTPGLGSHSSGHAPHTPSGQHVPGSTPWPGSGASWPGGVQPHPHGGHVANGVQNFGPQSFRGDPSSGRDAQSGGAGPSHATQVFPPMSSSSPSHPGMSASLPQPRSGVMNGPMGMHGSAQASAGTSSGVHGLPTPNPSFGGVPVQEPHTLSSNGSRKTAVLVAAVVFSIGLGATAFVVSRAGPTGASGTKLDTTSSPPLTTPAPPAIETAKPVEDPPPEIIEAMPSAAPSAGASAAPSASSGAPSAQPPPPAGGPRGPVKPPKPKKDFGY